MTTTNFLRMKKWKMTGIIVLLLVIVYGSSIITDFDLLKGVASIPGTITWIATNLIPDAAAMENLPKVLSRLWETIVLSVIASTTAAICAFFFAIFGSKTTQINRTIAFCTRFIASVFRNIPIVAWALVLVISFGHNVVTGYFALFISTFGTLVRMFMETIDEASADGVEALNATGATYFQMVFKGVLPDTMPQMLSWLFYMIETNIRSATLIGLLTGTGIGYLFDLHYKRLDYGTLGLITLSIIIVVIAIEFASNKVRRMIL
ncbi:ABC transporter permease subunit [Metasolibacillus sp. FSL H7-0170]|uniref:PhnE/PtxC family ABC transporter permease n=1 Tax=Metasolibacillus TaxID=2703677 RepID=UPI0007922E61|nr:ABC transporter permease subunit [Metasolibacillus fluoroglycofenilyticus]KYG89730.1 phosphonate ABC transporter permease [[Bacillus] sp. KCTC 13219]